MNTLTHLKLSEEKRFGNLVADLDTLDLRQMYSFMIRKGVAEKRTAIVEHELNKRS